MYVLARLLLVLFSVFAAQATSVALAQPHQAIADVHVRTASNGGPTSDDQLLVLFAEDDKRLVLAECEGGDDNPVVPARHSLPAAVIDDATSPAGPLFSFLRHRTKAPRAPPALA